MPHWLFAVRRRGVTSVPLAQFPPHGTHVLFRIWKPSLHRPQWLGVARDACAISVPLAHLPPHGLHEKSPGSVKSPAAHDGWAPTA